MNKKIILFCLFVFVAGALAGGLIDRYFIYKNPAELRRIRATGYKYISPLLYCENPPENAQFLKSLSDSLSNYINDSVKRNNISNASVYIHLPDTGDWTSVNGLEKYSPASLLKVPVMMAYYKSAEKNPALLSKEIKFDINDSNINENYMPKERLEKGKSYSVENLIERMIYYSDNTAEDLLVMGINEQEFDGVFQDMDITRLNYSHQENSMDVKTYSYFFRALYNASYLNRDYSEKALDNLSKTDFKKGIVAGVPGSITVAHKFGERAYNDSSEKQLHDCGIVYYPSHPYLICIMSRGNSFASLENTIKTISQKTYSAVSSWYEQEK